MVKRSKLTLEHTEVEDIEEVDIPESAVTEQSVASDNKGNLGKMLIMAGLTIASLIIFRQKFF